MELSGIEEKANLILFPLEEINLTAKKRVCISWKWDTFIKLLRNTIKDNYFQSYLKMHSEVKNNTTA